ncbi:MAG: hypothetical protein ACREHG_09690 [Candidatus Saccharimonadales bacterium]
MANYDSNPLTDEHLTLINQGIEAGTAAQSIAEKAKQAGMDVAELERQVTEGTNKLRRIKQVFFPGR